MEVQVLRDPRAVAQAAAAFIASEAREAVAVRGRFIMAVSGGQTPRAMLRLLAAEDLPWPHLHVVQVDERIAPAGDPARNLTQIREALFAHGPLQEDQLHPMPVEAPDLESAAGRYARRLQEIAGTPAVLDLVHLGLGADGHTASLVPGDPLLQADDRDVGVTGAYMGRRRMTLTYPALNRARRILWMVIGEEKAAMLARLHKGDRSIPAGLVNRDRALILADRGAAGETKASRAE